MSCGCGCDVCCCCFVEKKVGGGGGGGGGGSGGCRRRCFCCCMCLTPRQNFCRITKPVFLYPDIQNEYIYYACTPGVSFHKELATEVASSCLPSTSPIALHGGSLKIFSVVLLLHVAHKKIMILMIQSRPTFR